VSEAGYLHVRREGGLHIAALRGEVPIDQADLLRQRLPQLVRADAPHLFIDLSEARFIGSSALAAIIAAHNEAQRHGGRVLIVSPQPAIDRLLHVARIEQIIPIHPDLDSARAAIQST
jgi:anti-sigma B factor antagonist